MESETQGIRREVLRQCWHMRGGVTYDEAMQMSRAERQLITELIAENMETTKNTKLPFF